MKVARPLQLLLEQGEGHIWLVFRDRSDTFQNLRAWREREATEVIGQYAPRDHKLQLLADRDGKPYVQDARVAISISHSETALAVAVAGTGPIGVDIEDVSTAIEAQQIADQFFHPYEAAQLRKLDQPDRDLAFLFSWTLKEAALKATGAGLRAPLSSVRAAVSCCQQRNVSLAVTRTLPWPEPPSVGRTFRLESICGAAAGPVRRWRILRKVALTRACRVEPVVDVK